MGDSHFLLQNSLTGIVFLCGTLAGIFMVDASSAENLIEFILTEWQSLTVIILSPIIGVLIQGGTMFLVYSRTHPYESSSRKLIAERIRSIADSMSSLTQEAKDALHSAPDDSLFVWFYYKFAPTQLIEWARRRRDFQHLGENWAMGAFMGLISGAFAGIYINIQSSLPTWFLPVFILLFALIWCLGLIFLRRKMKQEADTLELIWLLGELYPQLLDGLNVAGAESWLRKS